MEILKRTCSRKKLKERFCQSSKLKSSKEKKANVISKPKRLDRYVAVAEYAVQANGEIALYPGLTVEVLEKSDSGWWFVNSEDEQGWAPSTFLEKEGGPSPNDDGILKAKPGQEENFICIEKFEAASSDEVSLEKGAVVQVLQKSMDGWWLIRYNGREAYAPGTYLKKATNNQNLSLMEKSRLSGVQIISSLHDVSTLLNQDGKGEAKSEGSPVPPKSQDFGATKKQGTSAVLVKSRSLERGGRLIPPPRQNSIQKKDAANSMNKSSIYVTAEDFCDTVGDGLSFRSGQKVFVKEKTGSGWWFVQIEDKEGWVPASYLTPYTGDMNTQSVYDFATHQDFEDSCDEENEDSDGSCYAEPDEGVISNKTGPAMSSVQMASRPLPPVPLEDQELATTPSKPLPAHPVGQKPKITANKSGLEKLQNVHSAQEKCSSLHESENKPAAGEPSALASALKSKFEARSRAVGKSVGDSQGDAKSSFGGDIKPLAAKPQTPILPNKPSEIKMVSKGNSLQPSLGSESRNQPFSKPLPPAKSKSNMLNKPRLPEKSLVTDDNTPKVVKSSDIPSVSKGKMIMSDDTKFTSGKNAPLEGGTVKSMTAAFNQSKVKPPVSDKTVPRKPQIATKPKPVISAKPSIPNKPKSEMKTGQVGSLVSSLSSKLNFGQNQNGAISSSDQSPSMKEKEVLDSVQSPAMQLQSNTCIALFDFAAENEGEISFNEGDEMDLLEDQGDWSLVRFWDEEGWAPSNYLKKV